MRRTLHSIFRELETEVLKADNNSEALEILEQEIVDLIVAERGIPLCNGAGLTQNFGKQNRNPPFLVFSRNGAEGQASLFE